MNNQLEILQNKLKKTEYSFKYSGSQLIGFEAKEFDYKDIELLQQFPYLTEISIKSLLNCKESFQFSSEVLMKLEIEKSNFKYLQLNTLKLKELSILDSKMEGELNLSHYLELEYIMLYKNNLKSIFTFSPKLKALLIRETSIEELDIFTDAEIYINLEENYKINRLNVVNKVNSYRIQQLITEKNLPIHDIHTYNLLKKFNNKPQLIQISKINNKIF